MAGEASAKVSQPARKDQPGPRTAKPGRPPLQPILALQQTAGNQAVARLVEERLKAKAAPEPKLPKIAPAAIQDGLIPEVSPAVAREAVPEREGLPAPSMPKPAAQAPSDVSAAVMPEREGPPPSPALKAAVEARLEVPAVAALAAVVPPPVPAPPPPAPKIDVQPAAKLDVKPTPAPALPAQAAPSAPAPSAEAAPGAQAGPAPEAAPAAASAEGGAEAVPGAPAAGAPEAAAEAPPAPEEAAKGDVEGEGKKEAKGEGKGEGKEEAKAAVGPEQDPAFQAVKARAAGAATQQKSHGPAGGAVGAAQAAAVGPANEVASQAAGAQVGQMDAQQPQPFDRAAFKAALLEKIAAITPKTLEEADDFKDDGKAGEVKDAVTSKVAEGKEQAQGPIQQATEATPDPSGFQPKPVTPLAPNDPGPPPPDLQAAGAAPKPKGEAEVEAPMAEASQSIDQKMADAEVSDEQLEQSNEPDFQSAVDSKREAQTNAAEAPGIYRADEQSTLSTAQAQAVSTAAVETEAMHGSRAALLNEVTGEQDTTKTADEQKRAEVSQHIETLYQETKQKVEDRLTRLDEEVNGLFDRGAEAARVAFEDYVDRRMNDYKDDRYDVIGGSLLWAKDKLFGMPDEVNAFYVEGRELYVQKMDAVIDEIATAVETGLTEAKGLIALGRQQVQEYVDSLPLDLQQVGQDAAQAIQDKFDSLEQSVQDKQGQLIDSLAKKYVDNLQKIDARIEELKAANRGLVDKVLDAIGEIIRTILKLKDMLLGVLARAASVIGKIIKNPIGFLGNLVEAVGLGLSNFMSNLGTHLKEGLLAWLFGALAEAGIQVPESFDLKGILSLILQVLGLTYANIRARAVAIVGEPVVRGLEQAAEVFKILLTEGPAGLWSFIQDKLSELKETVMEGIKSFIMEKVIIAGITWLIGLLNPAAAFIKACKAIYDIVMFFVTRGSQIITLINAILDSMAAIASGAIAGAAAAVENALAKAIPVVIGFLASLLGLGGISEKIRSILQQIRNPINKAIDFVIHQAVKAVKAVGRLIGVGKTEEAKADEDGSQVKERVRKDLTQRQTLLSSPDELSSLLDSVYATYSGQGLKSLWIEPSGEPGIFNIVASASAPEIVQRVAALEAELTEAQDKRKVFLVAQLDNEVQPKTYYNEFLPENPEEGPHAEENFAADFPNLLDSYQARHKKDPSSVLVIVRYSPCLGKCAPVFLGLRQRYPAVEWNVHYLQPYYGPGGSEKERSEEAVKLMKQQGIKVGQRLIPKKQMKKGT